MLILLTFTISIKFCLMPVKAPLMELYYDDGEVDQGDAMIANQTFGWGVKFYHPEYGIAYRIKSAKFYIFMEEGPLRLFVYLYNPSTFTYEEVYENIIDALVGWNVINLTHHDIIAYGDFIIGFNWVWDHTPYIGVDVDTESHSGTFQTYNTTIFKPNYGLFNYMIRAYITSETPPPPPSPSIHVRRFRLLAMEQMFDSYRMRSAQSLIEELLRYPNWNNSTDQYVSYIHLLSLYNYSEVDDAVKPFWRGNLSLSHIENEMTKFLGEATPGEIVMFYINGHRNFVNWVLMVKNFVELLKPEVLHQAFVTVILDTCSAGYFIQFLPDNIVLASSGKYQLSWGGNIGFFTEGLLRGFWMANDSNNDGWISAAEAFSHAKNFTESVVIWEDQNPESHYGKVNGDLPLVQRDIAKPFPTWDIAIISMLVNPLRTEPESPVSINVTVENQGVKYADFDVNIYGNSNLISTKQITLLPREVANVTFTWFPIEVYGLYMLSSTVSICPGEIDTSDNVCYGPYVTVAFKADINVDGKVDMKDVRTASKAFGSYPGHERWNPDADVSGDERVDMRDLRLITKNFGKTI